MPWVPLTNEVPTHSDEKRHQSSMISVLGVLNELGGVGGTAELEPHEEDDAGVCSQAVRRHAGAGAARQPGSMTAAGASAVLRSTRAAIDDATEDDVGEVAGEGRAEDEGGTIGVAMQRLNWSSLAQVAIRVKCSLAS